MITTEQLYNYFKKCTSVATDTRKIEEDTLFIALKGDNFDANTFAAEALLKGAKYAVIDNPQYKTDERLLLVEDSLKALQQLAAYHRKTLSLPIIALTGSNGKTTTKELISKVLSEQYAIKATVGNLNNHIGVPLTLLTFTEETEIGIVEMGANHQKEIEMLCNIATPNFGYITNFGKAHLEGFGGVEGVIKGKSELYTHLKEHTKTAIVNLDDPIQQEKTRDIAKFTFAIDDYNCDVRIEKADASPMVVVSFNGTDIKTNLIGSYNISNVCAAVAIGSFFKVGVTKIKKALEAYSSNNNRSQLIEKDSNIILLDAYNANPSSMAAALHSFKTFDAENKIAILGDMFELGIDRKEEHIKIVKLCKANYKVHTYFVGELFYAVKENIKNCNFFKSYNDLNEYISKQKPQNTALLIKGSRGMALERLMTIL